MYLIRITGAVFVLAGWLFYRGARRACVRGWTGPSRRPLDRTERPVRFRIAVGFEFLAALICFTAAYLCLTHAMTGFGG